MIAYYDTVARRCSNFFFTFEIFVETSNGGNPDPRRGDVQLAQGVGGGESEPVGLRGQSDGDDVERCDAERHVEPEKCDVNRYDFTFEKSSEE